MPDTFTRPKKARTITKQIVFMAIIVLAVSSISVLILTSNVALHLAYTQANPFVFPQVAVISFAAALALSIFHVSSMARRKRWTDRSSTS
jgi:membrane protein YdbS with pleckstrin-like domain